MELVFSERRPCCRHFHSPQTNSRFLISTSAVRSCSPSLSSSHRSFISLTVHPGFPPHVPQIQLCWCVCRLHVGASALISLICVLCVPQILGGSEGAPLFGQELLDGVQAPDQELPAGGVFLWRHAPQVGCRSDVTSDQTSLLVLEGAARPSRHENSTDCWVTNQTRPKPTGQRASRIAQLFFLCRLSLHLHHQDDKRLRAGENGRLCGESRRTEENFPELVVSASRVITCSRFPPPADRKKAKHTTPQREAAEQQAVQEENTHSNEPSRQLQENSPISFQSISRDHPSCQRWSARVLFLIKVQHRPCVSVSTPPGVVI